MANLSESAEWYEGIYQLERTDPVEGGINGVSNRPLRELASRTRWLRAHIASTHYVSQHLTATDTLSLDVSQASEFIITLSAITCALTFSGALSEDNITQQITLVLTQGTGVNKVVWPDNVRWQHDHIPVLSYTEGNTDVVTLVTWDNGVSWLGFYSGTGF